MNEKPSDPYPIKSDGLFPLPVSVPEDVKPIAEHLEEKHQENKAQIQENKVKIEETQEKVDEDSSKINEWGKLLSTPIGKIVGAMLISLLMFLASWVTDKMNPKVVPPVVTPVVTPIIIPTDPKVNPIPTPVPIVNKNKVIIYNTVMNEIKDKLPNNVEVKIFAIGLQVPWNGQNIPLPCMLAIDVNNKVIDIAPYAYADLDKFMIKNGVK